MFFSYLQEDKMQTTCPLCCKLSCKQWLSNEFPNIILLLHHTIIWLAVLLLMHITGVDLALRKLLVCCLMFSVGQDRMESYPPFYIWQSRTIRCIFSGWNLWIEDSQKQAWNKVLCIWDIVIIGFWSITWVLRNISFSCNTFRLLMPVILVRSWLGCH